MFITRTISGFFVLVATFGSILLGKWVLGIFTLLISAIGYRELIRCIRSRKEETGKILLPEIIGYLGILAFDLALVLELGTNWKLFILVLVFMANMFFYVFAFPKYRVEDVMGYVFAFAYCPLMLSFVFLTKSIPGVGDAVVWLIFISSWGCDTCAYLSGMLLGKRKVFPVLSPKKTLAGCIGGVLGAAVIGFVFAGFILAPAGSFVCKDSFIIAGISAAGGLMSMVGDLAASAIKRNMEIKDYGKLIPGHGGIMDRFDSVIVTAPVIYFLTVLFL